MKFSIISVLVVASTASAAAVPYLIPRAPGAYKAYYPRQAASINSTLSTINTNVLALTQTVTAYTGGLIAAAGVASKESTLDTSIKTATTAVSGMPKLSSAESKNMLASVNTLTPNIQKTITALVAKKAQFTSAGVGGTVATDIKNLQTSTDALGKALSNIASDDTKADADKALATIDASFKEASAAFAA